jgi:hypothetical protein
MEGFLPIFFLSLFDSLCHALHLLLESSEHVIALRKGVLELLKLLCIQRELVAQLSLGFRKGGDLLFIGLRFQGL